MVWAFMERELEKIRGTIITIDDLKRKVIYIWNRFPKKLCRNIVKRFEHLIEVVKKNNGNKENVKDRRDRRPKYKLDELNKNEGKKPKLILKHRLGWTNKLFEEYHDTIERIAYNEKTFLDFKNKYNIFIKREIAFFKKVNGFIGKYNYKRRSI